jgi:hypothetical protein
MCRPWNRRRNHLGQAIGFGVGHLQHPRDVAHGVAGGHPAKGDNVGHAVFAVFVYTVLDDFPAASVLDVNIDVGHADAVRIKEALEQQVVFASGSTSVILRA